MMTRISELINKRDVKAKTIVRFLENRGWELEQKTKRYYVLMPPIEQREDNPDFRFSIPLEKYEGTDAYWISVSGVIRSIAWMYEMEEEELKVLFSKSLMQIQKDKGIKEVFAATAVSHPA